MAAASGEAADFFGDLEDADAFLDRFAVGGFLTSDFDAVFEDGLCGALAADLEADGFLEEGLEAGLRTGFETAFEAAFSEDFLTGFLAPADFAVLAEEAAFFLEEAAGFFAAVPLAFAGLTFFALTGCLADFLLDLVAIEDCELILRSRPSDPGGVKTRVVGERRVKLTPYYP